MRRLLDAWRDRGWSVDPRIAVDLVAEATREGVSPNMVQRTVSSRDLISRGVPPAAFYEVTAQELGSAPIARIGDVLVPIDRIDSFARVRGVGVTEVAPILPTIAKLREEFVKVCLVDILGLPSVPKDWGGENDDVYSTHLLHNGERIAGSFALKGRSVPGRMRIRDLGKNGDQLVRLTSQPVDLFVIQHVNEVDSAVRKSLQNEIIAVRASRNPQAVGSLWDGVDTARLLVAHGYLDLAGRTTSLGERLLR